MDTEHTWWSDEFVDDEEEDGEIAWSDKGFKDKALDVLATASGIGFFCFGIFYWAFQAIF